MISQKERRCDTKKRHSNSLRVVYDVRYSSLNSLYLSISLAYQTLEIGSLPVSTAQDLMRKVNYDRTEVQCRQTTTK